MNAEIATYIKNHIIPQYCFFDKGHGVDHVEKVIQNSLVLAGKYAVDEDMAYVIAAFHDLGLVDGRENHHLHSGRILMSDSELPRWFNCVQMEVMKEAVEDHRASGGREPRTIYGKIVAEADRDISIETVLSRTLQYSLAHYPDYTFEEHFERIYLHVVEKYGENGYLRLWLDEGPNRAGLAHIRSCLADKKLFYEKIRMLYDNELHA